MIRSGTCKVLAAELRVHVPIESEPVAIYHETLLGTNIEKEGVYPSCDPEYVDVV